MVGFQKTDFGVSRACGSGNTKIGFIMRIEDMVQPRSSFCLLQRRISIFAKLGK
jgi:hypothetical protein